MTTLEDTPALDSGASTVDEDVAIRFSHVSKSYKLYDRPYYRLLDQIGLLRLVRPKAAESFHLYHALHDVNFSIGHGERVGLIGRNGAGKTTLLKLITDNFAPTTGTIEVNGSVQALMQLGIGFHPEFSGYENVKSALIYNGLSGTDLTRALEDVVDFVELGEFLHQPMKTYSLGMNARVQFAAATAIRPDIVLIDEILGAGDSYFAAKSAIRMDRLAKSGCTILLVSHSWQQIQQYCERCIWLRDGRVFMDGEPYEVLAAYEVHIAEETAKARSIPLRAKQQPSEHTEQNPSEPEDGEPGTSDAGVGQPSSGTDYATVAWVADRIREQDGVKAKDEFQDRLKNGQRVFRVAGIPGLRFVSLEVMSKGKSVTSTKPGAPLKIRFEIEADFTGEFSCSYWVHFFSLDGRRICRIQSPMDRFHLRKGEARPVEIDLGALLLGGGDYLLSFSIFDLSRTGDAADTLNTRFEMLARSYQLKVLEEADSDPPIIRYPAQWTLGHEGVKMPSIITGN